MSKKILKIKKDINDLLEDSKGKYENAFILGYDKNGQILVSYDGNLKDNEILWLLESFKMAFMNGDV